MTKKKVQRTDWKQEHALAVADRNYHQAKCEGLLEQIKEVEIVSDGRLRAVDRLEREQRAVGEQILAVSQIVNQLLTANEYSSTNGETIEHGRAVLLGRLIERLRQIPQPMPF